MGQYYRAIVKKQNGRNIVYNRYVMRNGKPEYMMAKLTEHSWWRNDFVNAVCLALYESKEKRRVAWIGDYAESYLNSIDKDNFNGLKQKQIDKLCERTWNCDGIAVNPTDFTLDGKFIVNHTKQEYFAGTPYFENSCMRSQEYGDWCMHPLPLLTCIGNGLGGGDYHSPTTDSTEEYIGTWAWDEISIEDKAPTDYTEIKPIFKEKGWEE